MNNSVEALIPFNEGYQSLLKVHVPFFSVGGNWGYLQKRGFSLKCKNNVRGGFSGPTEILFIF